MNPLLDDVKQYLSEIARYPVLSHEQEIALARRIQTNDARAKQKMIEANLRLVVFVAKKHQNRGIDLLDLIQEGNLGLIQAVEKFDPAQGCRFNTYAVYYIRNKILAAIYGKSRAIRLPSNITAQLRQLQNAYRGLTAFYERIPTFQELEYYLELPAEKIRQLVRVSQSILSLDQPLDEASGMTLGDSIEGHDNPDQYLEQTNRQERIHHLLSCLNEKQQTAVAARYGLLGDTSSSFAHISELIGVSKNRSRVIVEKAMRLLKEQAEELPV